MTAAAIGPLAARDSSRYAALAGSLALLVGLMALVAGSVRLGFVADLLSRPVVVGYLAGVALIMIAGQLGAATGVPVAGEAFSAQVVSFGERITGTRPAAASIAAAVLAFLFLVRWRWPRAPRPLLAVLLAAGCVGAFGLSRHGVQVAGRIPADLPAPALPDMSPGDLRELLLPAFTVFVVGFSDLVLTARAFARRGEHLSANRDLIALSVANAAVSMLRGFPVSSSASRTAIGTTTGSRTQLYSVTAAVVVVAVVVLAPPLLAAFPEAALAAIVIYAATRLIDVQAFRRLVPFRRGELVIACSALAGVLAAGILNGVLIAITVSVAELLLRVARPHDAILGLVPGLAGMHDVDDYPQARTIPGLVVYRYDAPLFFANAQDFRHRALDAAPQPRPAPLVRAERRGQRGGRLHRAGGRGGTTGRPGPRRRCLRARPCQAGPARPAGSIRPCRQDRPGPAVPDPAHRGRRLPAVGRRAGPVPGRGTGRIAPVRLRREPAQRTRGPVKARSSEAARTRRASDRGPGSIGTSGTHGPH